MNTTSLPKTNIPDFLDRLRRGVLPQAVALGDAGKYAVLDQLMPNLVPPVVTVPVPLTCAAAGPHTATAVVTHPPAVPRAPPHAPSSAAAGQLASRVVAVPAPTPAAPSSSAAASAASPQSAPPSDPVAMAVRSPGPPGSTALPKRTMFVASAAGAVADPAPPAAAAAAQQHAAALSEAKAAFARANDQLEALSKRKVQLMTGDDCDFVDDNVVMELDTRMRALQSQVQRAQDELLRLRRSQAAGGGPSSAASPPAPTLATAAPRPMLAPQTNGGAGWTSMSEQASPPTPWQASATSTAWSTAASHGGVSDFGGSGATSGASFQSMSSSSGAPGQRRGFQWDAVSDGLTREATLAAVQVVVNPKGEWDRETFPWSATARDMMRSVFALRNYRPCQLEVINATMSGRDVFVLLPTGGGKSLCYQLPAVLSEDIAQVTFVFSPLVSLIQDQVQSLRASQVAAAALVATTPEAERRMIFDEWRSLCISTYLVYITPEFFGRSDHFVSQLQHLERNKRIARFVIDEAHCISSWGHDFRTDYKKLQHLRKVCPSVPILALTATATDVVQRDILNTLGIPRACLFHASFNRPNLRYHCLRTTTKVEATVISIINSPALRGKCGIVYCLSKKDCETMAAALKGAKISADFYHSEAPGKEFKQNQWTCDRLHVMCATIAFGMGINKPDVRFVIHAALPKSIEGYYQESGRAGRDGLPAECHLLWCGSDKQFHDRMAYGKPDCLSTTYRMQEFALNNVTCRRTQQLVHFGEKSHEMLCLQPVEASRPANQLCDNCRSHQEDQWTPNVCDVTGDAVKLCKVIMHLGSMTGKQLIAVMRGTPSEYGPAITNRVQQKGMPPGILVDKAVPKEWLERTILLMLIDGVFRERLDQVGNARASNVVAYIEMGDPKAYQAICRKEKVLTFMSRKEPPKLQIAHTTAAATSAAASASAEPRQGKGAGRKGLTAEQIAAEAERHRAEDFQQQVSLVNRIKAREASRNSTGVPPALAPVGAVFSETQPGGTFPTPKDAGAPHAQHKAPPPTAASAAKTAVPNVARLEEEEVMKVRFHNACETLVREIANGKPQYTVMSSTAVQNLTNFLYKEGWGTVEDFCTEVDGLTRAKAALVGPYVLGLFRQFKARIFDNMTELTEAEEAQLRDPNFISAPVRRPAAKRGTKLPPGLVDDESPGRRPSDTADGGDGMATEWRSSSRRATGNAFGAGVEIGDDEPLAQLVGAKPALAAVGPTASYAAAMPPPVAPNPAAPAKTANVKVAAPKRTILFSTVVEQPRPAQPPAPADGFVSARPSAVVSFLPTTGGMQHVPEARGVAVATKPIAYSIPDDDDDALLAVCTASQFNTPSAASGGPQHRPSNAYTVASRDSEGHYFDTSARSTMSSTTTGAPSHRSSVLLVPSSATTTQHNPAQNKDELALTMAPPAAGMQESDRDAPPLNAASSKTSYYLSSGSDGDEML